MLKKVKPIFLAGRASASKAAADEPAVEPPTPRTPAKYASSQPLPSSLSGLPQTPRASAPKAHPIEPGGGLVPLSHFVRKQRRSGAGGGSVASSYGGSTRGSLAPPQVAGSLAGSLYVGNGTAESQAPLLAGIQAEPREVVVLSACSMDGDFYFEHSLRPGLCNVQLKARRASPEDLEAWPAQLALVDAMKHVLWLADNYDALEKDFPHHGWRDVMVVETGLNVPQQLLARLVASLYQRRLLVEPGTVEQLLHVSLLLQMPAVTEALLEYIKLDLIPLDPAACHALGACHPQLELEAAVLHYFRGLQWDGEVAQAQLRSLGAVLERCSEEAALDFVRSLTQPPALTSPMQVAAICTQVPASRRERLLQGLDLRALSPADLQSLLHWANNRRSNRAVLAESPILWSLLYDNLASSLLPLEQLRAALGPAAHTVKLWDVPLAYFAPDALAHRSRRSGWLHLSGGRSFCLEAIRTKDEPGAEWGLFCKPDQEHALQQHYTVWLFALQQGSAAPRVQRSPPFAFTGEKRPGLSLGFDAILSEWAADAELVWAKQGEPHLTLGLYVDAHDSDSLTDSLSGGPAGSPDGNTAQANGHATQKGLAELQARESALSRLLQPPQQQQPELPPEAPAEAAVTNGGREEQGAVLEILPDVGHLPSEKGQPAWLRVPRAFGMGGGVPVPSPFAAAAGTSFPPRDSWWRSRSMS